MTASAHVGPQVPTLVAPVPTPLVAAPLASTQRATSWFRSLGLHGPWILAWASLSWLGTIWSPALLAHPVALMLLAPRAAFIVLAAPHLGLLQFVALGTTRLAVTDASWFIVGKRFPDRPCKANFLSRIPMLKWTLRVSAKLCSWVCSTRLLAAAVLFFRPNGKYLGVAGANGVSSRLAGASSILGTVAYLVAVHVGAGSFFG